MRNIVSLLIYPHTRQCFDRIIAIWEKIKIKLYLQSFILNLFFLFPSSVVSINIIIHKLSKYEGIMIQGLDILII